MHDDTTGASEKFDYPKLTDEQDTTQRGEDPPSTRPGPTPEHSEPTPEEVRRQREIRAHIDRWVKEKGRTRQDGLWPYLLIRAVPGDHGVRPLTVPFWESPDVIVVPGVHDTYDGVSATLTPRAGVEHTIFVHVWNLGRLPTVGVKLRVYWANPSFSFNDPTHPPQFIGGRYVDLDDRTQPGCHRLVRIPTPWVPTFENNGHECLLAKLDHFADGGGAGFDARLNRHIGQRNLNLLPANANLDPLLKQLSQTLSRGADLQLVHAMQDVSTALLVHQPGLVGEFHAPRRLPSIAQPVDGGFGHLGGLVRSSTFATRFVPARVIAPNFDANRIDPSLLTHAGVQEVGPSAAAVVTLFNNLNIADLSAGGILKRLQALPGEAHMLRIQATDNGQLVGGYTLILHN